MIEAIGQFGSGIGAALGTLAILGGAFWLTDKTLSRFYPEPADKFAPHKEPGCLVFGLTMVMFLTLLSLIFYPAIDAMKRHSCKGANDFELCVEGEPVGGNDWM